MARLYRGMSFLGVCLMLASVCSCSIFRGKGDGEVAAGGALSAAPAVSQSDLESELRKEVQKGIEVAARVTPEQRDKLVYRKPYYFRQHDVYTGSAADAKVLIQEKDSHSVPYVADVTLAKQRFATRLHRNRAEADRDLSFLRETGTETVTYEYRNGRWVRSGSLFVAETTEEKVDGTWVPVKEELKRTVEAEEGRGWFGRTWSKITGN